MPAASRQRLLRATNDSVIKLNHVVHHGAIGHHVQNWHAFRAESRIGQIAAVDCASRIALFCGGTMAEGWACYATDLMDEFGFLTPLEHFAERRPAADGRARAGGRAAAPRRVDSRPGGGVLPGAGGYGSGGRAPRRPRTACSPARR